MDECQFYDKKRLEQLHRQEEQLFAEAKEKGDIPNDLSNYEVHRCTQLPQQRVFYARWCCFYACTGVCGHMGGGESFGKG